MPGSFFIIIAKAFIQVSQIIEVHLLKFECPLPYSISYIFIPKSIAQKTKPILVKIVRDINKIVRDII